MPIEIILIIVGLAGSFFFATAFIIHAHKEAKKIIYIWRCTTPDCAAAYHVHKNDIKKGTTPMNCMFCGGTEFIFYKRLPATKRRPAREVQLFEGIDY